MNAARRRAVIGCAAASVAGVGLAGGGDPHAGHRMTTPAAPSAPSAFQREMDASMATMMAAMHAPGYSGDPDADFLAMMVPHHEGAIEMARLVLLHGRDPVTRELAQENIAGQTVEIDGMRRRLALLRRQPAPRPPEFPSLGGTRGP